MMNAKADRLARRLNATPYLLAAPAFAFILFIYGLPILQIFVLSFGHPTVEGTTAYGLNNYQFVLADAIFWQALRNNVFLLIGPPVMVVVALVAAAILFDQVRFWRFYRTMIFLPYILAVPIIGITFGYLYGYDGIVNQVLRAVGAGGLAQPWLGDPNLVTPSILTVIIYREMGFGVMLLLARMSSIQEELYEAAMLDGAGWWARLRYITIPQTRSVIQFFVVIELITMLSWVFAYVYSISYGGPGFASFVLEIYIWKNAFDFHSPGIASAAAVIMLAGVAVLIMLQMTVRRGAADDEVE